MQKVIVICLCLTVLIGCAGVVSDDIQVDLGPTDEYSIAVLILPFPHDLGKGWQLLEFRRIYEGFRDLTDAEVSVVTPIEGVTGVKDSANQEVPAHLLYDFAPDAFDVLVVIGGSGPSYWLEDADLHSWLSEMGLHGKIMGGVCGGVTVLGSAGLLSGINVATNSKYGDLLTEYGANYTGEGLEWDGQFWTFSFGMENQFLQDFLPILAGAE